MSDDHQFCLQVTFLQVNGMDLNHLNSLSDIDHVLKFVEDSIADLGNKKSPSMEAIQEYFKLVELPKKLRYDWDSGLKQIREAPFL